MNVKLLIDKVAVLDLECKNLLASNTPLAVSIKEILNRLSDHYGDAREKFINNTFQSTSQEIDYFKLYHSQLISLFLYYKSVQNIEQRLIYKSLKKQLKILKEEVDSLNGISDDHHDFIIYLTENKTHKDEEYFTLNPEKKSSVSFTYMERDPAFSTHYSFLLGKILSTHRTLEYINGKVDSLKNRSIQSSTPLITLNWNGKKVEYVEVIRALHAEGAFTDEISFVFKALSQVINIGPLDHFSIYKDIKKRTNATTKYLNKAADALQERINNEYD